MSLHIDPAAEVIGTWAIPLRGTYNFMPPHTIPSNALFTSLNVFIREGRLRNRPGLTLVNATQFDSPILGGDMAVSTTKTLLAFSRNKLYRLREGEAQWITSGVNHIGMIEGMLGDMTFLDTNGGYFGFFADQLHQVRVWSGGLSIDPITPTLGVVPIATSICSAFDRLVTLVLPHTLRWTSALDFTKWSELNVVRKAETNDSGICVKAMGTVSFVFYKERSIYVGMPQAGPDSLAFRVEYRGSYEGPAGIHAVVDVDGYHYYMTKSGRVGVFDTSRVTWIADGMWQFLQKDIEAIHAYKIFGVYDYRLNSVIFYYPKIGDEGQMKGMLIINLPYPESGIEGHAYFIGYSAKGATWGYASRLGQSIDRSIIFTTLESVESVYLDEDVLTDDGLIFNCSFQTNLIPTPNLRHTLFNIILGLERQQDYGYVDVNIGVSDMLEHGSGRFDALLKHTIDLNRNPVSEYLGFDISGRFVSLRLNWTSDSLVKYSGATLYGTQVE